MAALKLSRRRMLRPRSDLIVLVLAFLGALLLPVREAMAQRNLTSLHRADEFDTGDPDSFRGLAGVQAGQAGGEQWGSGYAFRTLRCGNDEAIVGARIRRGDVLDFIQVACATPVCTGGACQWNQFYWGPWAGNPAGGDPHPSMVCNQNEMVSGFRGRVITFTIADYVADIEIQCSRIRSSDGPNGPFRVTRDSPTWHHPEGGLRIGGTLPGSFLRTEITGRIGCRPFGGANAISTGVANFVLPGQRVVQAVSMYCPATRPRPTDQGLYPQCLYATSAYQNGQVVRLRADTLAQGITESYNCFAYAETFILGAVPGRPLFGTIGLDSITITTRWLNQHGYSLISAAPTLGQLPSAQLGDLVMVENRLDKSVGSFQWYHVAIVIGVDSTGRITRLRQKPDANRCVSDTTAAQFETVDPVQDGELYELWRNPSLNWSAMVAP
jgi:hypothetical protein